MQYTGFYVIRPRPALEQRVADWPDGDVADVLREPVLWTNEEGGKTVYGPDDYVHAVKVLFVAHVRYLLLRDEAAELLGELPLSEETFDRWWRVEVFSGYDERLDDVLEEVLASDGAADLAGVAYPYVRALVDAARRTDATGLADLWDSGDVDACHLHLAERLPESQRPAWGLAVLDACVEASGVGLQHEVALRDIVASSQRWGEAHDLFRLLRQQRNASCEPSTLADDVLWLAEQVAKVTYNATGPRAPFDRNSFRNAVDAAMAVTRHLDQPQRAVISEVVLKNVKLPKQETH